MGEKILDTESLISTYLTHEATYKPGEVIIEEGNTDDWVYILLEGKVKVTKRTPVGRLTLAVLQKGSVFGEMEFFGKALKARCASVIAADDDVRVGVLHAQRLTEDYESLSLELRMLIETLIMELKGANEEAVDLIATAGRPR